MSLSLCHVSFFATFTNQLQVFHWQPLLNRITTASDTSPRINEALSIRQTQLLCCLWNYVTLYFHRGSLQTLKYGYRSCSLKSAVASLGTIVVRPWHPLTNQKTAGHVGFSLDGKCKIYSPHYLAKDHLLFGWKMSGEIISFVGYCVLTEPQASQWLSEI